VTGWQVRGEGLASNKAVSATEKGSRAMNRSQQRARYEARLAAARRALEAVHEAALDVGDDDAAYEFQLIANHCSALMQSSLNTKTLSLVGQLKLT